MFSDGFTVRTVIPTSCILSYLPLSQFFLIISSYLSCLFRLYVFGGWVPVGEAEDTLHADGVKWVCTDSLSMLNLGMIKNNMSFVQLDNLRSCFNSKHCFLLVWFAYFRHNDMAWLDTGRTPAKIDFRRTVGRTGRGWCTLAESTSWTLCGNRRHSSVCLERTRWIQKIQ